MVTLKSPYKFKRLQMNIAEEQLNKKYKDYRQCPTNHPDYTKEWVSFWSRRFKELRAGMYQAYIFL